MKKKKETVPFVHVDVSFLANEIGETATNTFDGSESEHDLLFSIYVGVQNTQYVLEILVRYQRLRISKQKKIKNKKNSITGNGNLRRRRREVCESERVDLSLTHHG